MKSKKLLLFSVIVLLAILSLTLIACDDFVKPNNNTDVTEVYELKDLNVYLGRGVWLPGEETDKITLKFKSNVVDKDFLEKEPQSFMGNISYALLEIDEYDLHIEVTLTENEYNLEEVSISEFFIEEDWQELTIKNKKVIKLLKDNIVQYEFVDNFYYYNITVKIENNKTQEENIETIEKFISEFKRFNYYY